MSAWTLLDSGTGLPLIVGRTYRSTSGQAVRLLAVIEPSEQRPVGAVQVAVLAGPQPQELDLTPGNIRAEFCRGGGA